MTKIDHDTLYNSTIQDMNDDAKKKKKKPHVIPSLMIHFFNAYKDKDYVFQKITSNQRHPIGPI